MSGFLDQTRSPRKNINLRVSSAASPCLATVLAIQPWRDHLLQQPAFLVDGGHLSLINLEAFFLSSTIVSECQVASSWGEFYPVDDLGQAHCCGADAGHVCCRTRGRCLSACGGLVGSLRVVVGDGVVVVGGDDGLDLVECLRFETRKVSRQLVWSGVWAVRGKS